MTEEARAHRRAMLVEQNCLFEKIDDAAAQCRLHEAEWVRGCQPHVRRRRAGPWRRSTMPMRSSSICGTTAAGSARRRCRSPDTCSIVRHSCYDPRPNSPVPARTASPIPGNKLADKPVYVLTSSSTQSAAEYFVYNLKMLKRVTIVGETTAGRQHSGAFHRINEHFGMGIQEVAPPDNPYPVKGWEVIGIEPDVKVLEGRSLRDGEKTRRIPGATPEGLRARRSAGEGPGRGAARSGVCYEPAALSSTRRF